MQRHLLRILTVLGFVVSLPGIATAQPAPLLERVSSQTAPPLTQPALEALVSGIALYPDPLVQTILSAAQHPAALHQTAQGHPGSAPPRLRATAPESVRELTKYPEVLQQLDKYLLMTTRLGRAYQRQPEDVWKAITAVRNKIELEAATVAVAATNSSSPNYAAVSETVARRLLAPAVLAELVSDPTFVVVAPTTVAPVVTGQAVGVVAQGGARVAGVAAGTVTTTGPQGNAVTATGAGVAGTTTTGATTTAGAAGAGTVTTSSGTSVSGAGAATGSVTKTDSGATFSTQATGASRNNNTGATATGSHSGSGTVTQNAGGSTTVNRAGTNQVTTPQGNVSTTHTGTTTAGGAGNSNYQGSSQVTSPSGTASTNTTAGGGQASTTVTTGQGTKTYTAGDRQVTPPPSNQPTQRNTHQPQSRTSSNRYSQMNQQQIAMANKSLDQNWGMLNQHTAKTNPAKANPAKPSHPPAGSHSKPAPQGKPAKGKGGRR